MLVFPQLSTGASVQYPMRKQCFDRTIVNITQDGRTISLSDSNAKTIRWDLAFQGLTDQELSTLIQFYTQCEGSLKDFLFLDPSSNLLAFSEDLTQSAWQVSSLLEVTPGIVDPFGSNRATRVFNSSPADLAIIQRVPLPGSVWTSFSCYLRTDQPGSVTFTRTDGSTVTSRAVVPNSSWARFNISTVFGSSVSSYCDFSISLQSRATLDVFGFQVDAQPAPSAYLVSSGTAGVYPNSRFDMDELSVTCTGPGQNSTRLSIFSLATQ